MPVTMERTTSCYDREAMNEFIMMPVSNDMIRYLAQKASEVLQCGDDAMPPTQNRGQPITPPESPRPGATTSSQPALPSVDSFIRNLVKRSHVEVPTLMTSLVFLARLRAKLPPMSKGMRCTPHRIFLASLILAAKNLNDSSPKNKHWARYTILNSYEGFGFSLPEVNLMERQLLALLDWDTRVREEDLFDHFEPFLAPIRDRLQLQDQVEAAIQGEWQLQASMLQKSSSRSVSPRSHYRIPSRGVYDSPMSMSSYSGSYIHCHKRRQSSYGGGRSRSPPSLRDVPGLSYEASIHGSSSRSSSIAPSSRGTPASFSTYSTTDVMLDDSKHSPSALSSYVTIHSIKPKAKTQVLPGYGDVQQQHTKRAKTGGAITNGNLFTRFFSSAANSYAEKLVTRAAARG
ncbi:cyclin [Coccidioides immitis RS]|uniref:Cyclin n=5 Tax=Coccidioides TaxID=5500 RepID=A0A0E1RXG3_COCIM|nr:cyclin [Coccidioides immitis RS]EAS33930.1 cyclin [Coccidioides immitis RS]EFW14805.1 cyclin [Coccidioides posadasii str. Silveira]KMM70471.1 cyclin [Coccidioides posadasii RMSCC 3488]KMP05138.1 cyclin [Coccidioides immitis RMSCC 2394]